MLILTIILRQTYWSDEACEMFCELASVGIWEPLIAKVKGYKKRSPIGYTSREDSLIPCIDLYDTDGDKVRDKRNEWIFSD